MVVSLLGLGIGCIEDAGDGGVNRVPLVQQTSQNLFAFRRESVEALIAFVLFAPLTRQQTLSFQAAEKRVKSALVNLQAALSQVLAERVAVVLLPKLCQDGKREAAPAELESEIFKRTFSYGHARSSESLCQLVLCSIHCTSHTVCQLVCGVKYILKI